MASFTDVLAEVPARVRRDRALRRHLRDREHALDHDRPAHARVRDAADARRDAAPGAAVGDPRGIRHRPARFDRRPVRSASGWRRASTRSSSRSGSTCRRREPCSRRARSSSLSLVGTVVTLLASLMPALRATRVEPIAAVREGAAASVAACALRPSGRARHVRRRARASALRLARQERLRRRSGCSPLGVGVLVLFVGIALLAPRVRAAARKRPRLAGGALRRRRRRARSRQRARNPARTASTAAALMIGLALVTAVAVLASGSKSTFETRSTSSSTPIMRSRPRTVHADRGRVRACARQVPGVQVVSGVRAGEARVLGHDAGITGVEQHRPRGQHHLAARWAAGARRARDRRRVHRLRLREEHDLSVGSPVPLHSRGQAAVAEDRVSSRIRRAGRRSATSRSPRVFDRTYQTRRTLFTFVEVAAALPPRTRELERARQLPGREDPDRVASS